ncbi:MAG: biotin--[acetyl-CoA-carboxylase] ligase [Oscillospiraceae bacterium]|nr:biotin--[acetyl-CoA-carboxylase] ligase [Oscillospiraceae bacterium]
MSTKKYVLELLEGSRGVSISGGKIAARLNVSRSAVWKAVKGLERDGYRISAVTNKGYCLAEDCDLMSVEGIKKYLPDLANPVDIRLYDTLESTNTTAKELAVAGAGHGTLIVADYLSGARGRYGRSFFTKAGCGIYMTVILQPPQTRPPTLITSYAALSVCLAIEELTGKMPQIKWVNDILLYNRKLCGILTEAITDYESGCVQCLVVGVGINFIEPDGGFPENIREIAGAIFDREESPSVTRNRLAAEVYRRIMNFGDCDKAFLLEQYRKRLVTLGQRITVSGAGEPFEAVAMDIDENCGLVVKKSQRDGGEVVMLTSGEVSLSRL